MEKIYRIWKQLDWFFLGLILLLIFMGSINLYSISRSPIAPQGLFLQQMFWYGGGLALFLLISFVDLNLFKKYGWILYLVGFLLLIVVLIHGKNVNGASRWLRVGSFSFQPSEFIKIGILLVSAKLFASDSFDLEFKPLRYVVSWYAIWIIPVLLIMKQPDLGTALICILLAMSLFLLIRIRPTAKLAVLGLNLFAFALVFKFGLKDYQKNRFLCFLNPEQDPTGTCWHAIQAKFAISNGHIWGQGFLKGSLYQKVPEVWSDFPFTAFAEEWGFVGCLVLFLFYLLLIVWMLRIANEAKDLFSRNIVLGCAALLFWHIVFNIGMVIGLAPVVGVTLPLFSHGGSSLLAVIIGLGLCMNVSIYKGLLPGK